MSETTESNFANDLSAGMSNVPVNTYVDTHEDILHNLTKVKEVAEKIKVRNMEEFNKAREIKGMLSSLFCYTANNKKTEFDEVAALEGKVGKKMAKFASKYGRVKGDLACLLRYVIHMGGWSYRAHDRDKIVKTLLANNLLYKSGDHYFVTGLHLAVGDNTFGVSPGTGREYRLYCKTCVIQAFYVNSMWNGTLKEMNVQAPELPAFYEKTDVADGKYCARVYLSRKDKDVIARDYLLN